MTMRPLIPVLMLMLGSATLLANHTHIWEVWPTQGPFQCHVRTEGEPPVNVTVFNAIEGAGHASRKLHFPPGKCVKAISFHARKAPTATRNNQEVMLVENSGEAFFINLKLNKQWTPVTITPKQLKLYPYGGAVVQNGRLDLADVKSLKFNCFPKGGACEIKNLKITTEGLKHEHKITDTAERKLPPEQVFDLEHIHIPEQKKEQNFPNLTRITVKDNQFVKDGKPYFMLGGWQLDQEGPPWIMKALGLDVTVYNADEIYTLIGGRRQPDGKIKVRWEPTPWYPAIIRRFLENNLQFWHEHKGHPRYNALRKFPEFKDFHGAGHFVPYDPFQKIGVDCYLEMFKSWMRYTRNYPIFTYELFNEMLYDNTHKGSRDAFQAAMKHKFKENIQQANHAWKTDFESFQHVQPPGFIADGGTNPNLPRELLTQREARQFPNLFVDWQKFQEQRCYDAVKMLMPKMRQFDPDPRKLQTLQSHMQFRTDFANCGIKPETLVDFSHFYSHEAGAILIDDANRQEEENLLVMLKTGMVADLVRDINPHKPSFDAEAPINLKTVGAPETFLRQTDLANLNSTWKFYDATTQLPPQWQSPETPDQHWKEMTVPAMWGKKGFPNCTRAIYRKHVTLTPPPKTGKKKIYLNGQGFADTAEIWFNGTKIAQVNGFNKKFTVDITEHLRKNNLIAVKIENTFFSEGMYFGGIRGFASINDQVLVPEHTQGLQPKHLRTALWNMAAHGLAGLMVSYEATLFSPAAKALPQIKAQINSAAPILFDPNAQPKTPIALVYPLETFRTIVHQDYLQKLKGPATCTLLRWYAPLLFSRRGLKLIRNQNLTPQNLKQVKLLAMNQNTRVTQTQLENVKQYVRQGGNLLLDVNAMTINDETHQPRTLHDFCGFEKLTLHSQTRQSRKWGTISPRFLDGFSYATGKPLPHTNILAVWDDNTPLLTMTPYGQGKVFCLTANLDLKHTGIIMEQVLEQTTETPEIQLNPLAQTDKLPPYTEAKLYAQNSQRFLLYIHNWGKNGQARAALPKLPQGNYIIRNLVTGNQLPGPQGKTWNHTELKRGIPLKLNTFEPVTLLIENQQTTPLKIKGIAPLRRHMLDELWSVKPLRKNQPTVAISAIFGGTTKEIHGVIPTAAKILTDNGFNVIPYKLGKTDLKNLKVLVWQQQKLPMDKPQEIMDFVKNGGGLLLCGNALLTYHNKGNNDNFLKKLGLTLGRMHRTILYNQQPDAKDVLAMPCTDFLPHPISAHVSTFITAGSGFLNTVPPEATVILKAPKQSNAPGKPLIVTMKYGKGNIIWISDHWFLRPGNLEKGDNPQLWFNAITYLAQQTVTKLTPTQLEKALFITADKLRQAELDEKDGQFDRTPVICYPSILTPARPEDMIGIDGGDPIVDQFK